LLTGRPPFQAETPLDTLLELMEKDPVPPRQLNPRLDRGLAADIAVASWSARPTPAGRNQATARSGRATS
jgi:hypothetical protein